LQLFCHFSPGHVLVYWLFLPTLASDPRPSVTVVTTILLEMLLSSQLHILQSNFSQQEKDAAIISKEVMGEYDKKFVRPRLNPLMRDVATQYTTSSTDAGIEEEGDVTTYTPTVVLKREFRTKPNPRYAKHFDPDNMGSYSQPKTSPAPAPAYTPAAYSSREPTPSTGITPRPTMRQPVFRQNASTATTTGATTGDGGSLGVYSHANSPLKKATSMYDIQSGRREAPRNSFDMAGREIQEQRERSMSPAKRQSEAHRSLLSNSKVSHSEVENDRRTSAPSGFAWKQRPGPYDSPYKRGPSRF